MGYRFDAGHFCVLELFILFKLTNLDNCYIVQPPNITMSKFKNCVHDRMFQLSTYTNRKFINQKY